MNDEFKNTQDKAAALEELINDPDANVVCMTDEDFELKEPQVEDEVMSYTMMLAAKRTDLLEAILEALTPRVMVLHQVKSDGKQVAITVPSKHLSYVSPVEGPDNPKEYEKHVQADPHAGARSVVYMTCGLSMHVAEPAGAIYKAIGATPVDVEEE